MNIKQCSVVASYILGYVYVVTLFSSSNNELWGTIFFLGFVLWVEGLYRYQNKRFSAKEEAEAYFFLICLAVVYVSANFNLGMINSQHDIPFMFSQLIIHSLAIYWVVIRLKLSVEGKSGDFFIVDLFNGVISQPFNSWLLRMKIVNAGIGAVYNKLRKNKGEEKRIIPTALVLIVAFMLLVTVIAILGSIDENFAKIFSLSPPEPDLELTVYILLSIPVGCYLFGLVFAGYKKHVGVPNIAAVKGDIEKMRSIGTATLTIILVMFSAVYAVYIGLQIGYFFGGFFGELPQDFTYSEYARRGFFELCIIMGINLGILTAVAKLSLYPLRSQKVLKITGIIFLIICIFFAITAMSKLLLYIEAYGFTALRLLSGWGIIVLIVATVLAIISLLKPINAVRYLLFYLVASYAVACII